jgi:eukaryotic translation initiation factor 2C
MQLRNQFLDRNNRLNYNAFEQFLKMLDIEYRFNGITKTFGFNGLKEAANRQTFVLENGQKLTVADYFARERNCRLQRPELEVLWVGSKVRNVYLPMEFCWIPAGEFI